MKNKKLSIMGRIGTKDKVEDIARIIVTLSAFTAVISVFAITIYMIIAGVPAIFEVGLKEIIFGTVWMPNGVEPRYGVFYVIITSIVGTFLAVLIGVPIGILTAIFIAETAPRPLANVVKPAVELLAGIPSVIYGLLGVLILNPFIYKIEMAVFKDSPTHQFTGGSNLISAVLVLAIMILPTVINISENAIKAVPKNLMDTSLALGATKTQTIFKVILPAAKSGIAIAVVLGVGRAIGEAMAISLVAGNGVNFPLPFNSVRFLTTALVSEMSYGVDTHRRVLFTIGLILFVFIIMINLFITKIMKGEDHDK